MAEINKCQYCHDDYDTDASSAEDRENFCSQACEHRAMHEADEV